jgi:hypothetical protein
MTSSTLWLAVALCTTLGATATQAKLAGNGPAASASPLSAGAAATTAAAGKQRSGLPANDPRVVPDPPPPAIATILLPDGTALQLKP